MERTIGAMRTAGTKWAVLASIAFEDTEERERLRSAGYRWNSIRRAWESPASDTASAAEGTLRDLIARGYVLEISFGGGRGETGLFVHRMGKGGVDLDTIPYRLAHDPATVLTCGLAGEAAAACGK